MKKTLIIGANGKIGRLLLSEHLDSLAPAVAMVRDGRNYDGSGCVDVVEADLEHDIQPVMVGCDTVVFTAGSGAATGLDKTLLVDLWGARNAIDAAKRSGIRHFIMVSSRGADNPDHGPQSIKPYLVAKHFADEYLVASGLNYTILRPGRLTDEKGAGLISVVRPENPEKQLISREDTATAIAHCINNPSVINKIYELYQGADSIDSLIR